MKIDAIKRKIQNELNILPACTAGQRQLSEVQGVEDLIECFWEYCRFCVYHGFPSANFIAQYVPSVRNGGIYANERNVHLKNCRQVALLGNTNARLDFSDGGCAHIIITDNAVANISLMDGFALFVDVLGHAKINVVASDYSRLRVHSYTSTCSLDIHKSDNADCRVIKHDTESYI